jgi:pimeloyl-ACP methyl ester carboxylesterase
VLFIHDHATTAFDTTPLFQYVVRSYNAMAIDLPGFGRTVVTSKTRLPDPADAVHFMASLVYCFLNMSFKKSITKKFVLVGFGTGAQVAADLAATYPELFTHALLCCPVGVFPQIGPRAFAPPFLCPLDASR